MASKALASWEGSQSEALDELVNAHKTIGGTGPGRRYATDQINHAYLMAVAAQFQRFCRDLHSEASAFLAANASPPTYETLVSAALTEGRQLDRGNAQSASVGSDFGRFEIQIWTELKALDVRNARRRARLDQLNTWRNAIAHQDFVFTEEQQKLIEDTSPTLKNVRRWRDACNQLALALDRVVADHLEKLVRQRPW